jgi:hypothetical protein
VAIKKISKTGVGFLIDASAKTYETIEKQLREFVSNSLDAGATKIEIEVVPTIGRITITDNGEGMTEEEFDSQYLVIGCSQKYGDPTKIGRIGVGKFSAIPLSDTLKIRTKKSDRKDVYQAKLNLKALKDPKNRTKNIAELELGDGAYVDLTSDDPNQDFANNKSFTKVILEGVPQEILKVFEDEKTLTNLYRKLGVILPLKYSEQSEAMRKLKSQDIEMYNYFLECSKNRNIEVKVRSPLNKNGDILFRPLFGDDYAKSGEQISGDLFLLQTPDDWDSSPIKIIGYLADMSSGRADYADWRGVNVRVQNTTVVENFFFNHDDPPADARITGELHILNSREEDLITMNRAGFVTQDPQYQEISLWATMQIDEFARSCIRKRTAFRADLKKKQAQLTNQKLVAMSIENSLNTVFSDAQINMESLQKGELKKETEIDEISTFKSEFPNMVNEIIPMPDSSMTEIEPIMVGNQFSLQVPESLLEYRANIQGIDYWIKYVDHTDEEPVVDVDVKNAIIRVNKNSPAIQNGKHTMALTYILIELAFSTYGNNMALLKDKIHEVLRIAFA